MAFLPFPFGALNTALSLLLMHSISLTMFKSFLNQTLPSMETFQNGSKFHISLSKPTAKISSFLPEELKFLQQHIQSRAKKTLEQEALKLLNLESKNLDSNKNNYYDDKKKTEPFSGSLSLHNNIKNSFSDITNKQNKNNIVLENTLKNIDYKALDLSPINLNSMKPNIIHVHHDINEEEKKSEVKNLEKPSFNLNSIFSKRQGSIQKKSFLPVIKEISLDHLSKIIKKKKRKEIKKEFRNICSYLLEENLKIKLLEDLSFCTHLMIFGLKIDENYKISFQKPIEDSTRISDLMKLKNKKLKIILSLEDNDLEKLDKISSSEEITNLFVDSLIELIFLHNLDGLNFNFDFKFDDQELSFLFNNNLINMLQYLKKEVSKIKNNIFILTATLPLDHDKVFEYFDVKSLNNIFDQINLIGYKIKKKENSFLLNHSSLFTNKEDNLTWSIENLINKGLDLKKLNIGLSTFGKKYLNGKNNTLESLLNLKTNQEIISYSEVCRILSKKETIFLYNEKLQSPFAYDGNDLITFENEKSLSMKTKNIFKFKIKGVFLFALNYDDVIGECYGNNYNDNLNEWNFPLHKVVFKTSEYAAYINKLN